MSFSKSFSLINSFTNKATNWLAPAKCINCQNTLNNNQSPCCTDCYLSLPFEQYACRRCGQPFAASPDYCGRCLAHPLPFDSCFCPFKYEHPIDEQIRHFKYGERPELATQIAKLLKHEIETHLIELPELLIPVPMHINKLRQRGFNQSLLLAKALSKLLDIPYTNNVVIKHRATPPQAGQTLNFRQKNLAGSFKAKMQTKVKSVAIVDDVITTGSTAAEITKILKRNGVDYIQIWGIAHTV